MLTPIKRQYGNFAGVDFTNDPAIVQLNRSPDALNVYRNYSSTQGNCIETRPGIAGKANFEENVNNIIFYKNQVLVHAGTKLYKWNNYPSEPAEQDKVLLKSDMANTTSSFFIFKDKLYINDGNSYLVYDGGTLKNVYEDAFVPTTTISRSPSRAEESYFKM